MTLRSIRKITFAGAILLAFAFTGCTEKQQEETGTAQLQHEDMGGMEMNKAASDEAASTAGETSVAFAEADGLAVLLPSYQGIKSALVNDDQEQAKQAAGAMLEKLGSIDRAKLNQQQGGLLAEHEKELGSSLNQIVQAQDISTLRQSFASLSNQMYQLVKEGNLTSPTLYWQHCPMALNGQGANWLSTEEKVRNPFLGQKMPGCGSVEETL